MRILGLSLGDLAVPLFLVGWLVLVLFVFPRLGIRT